MSGNFGQQRNEKKSILQVDYTKALKMSNAILLLVLFVTFPMLLASLPAARASTIAMTKMPQSKPFCCCGASKRRSTAHVEGTSCKQGCMSRYVWSLALVVRFINPLSFNVASQMWHRDMPQHRSLLNIRTRAWDPPASPTSRKRTLSSTVCATSL
jgi:hypothetical protein